MNGATEFENIGANRTPYLPQPKGFRDLKTSNTPKAHSKKCPSDVSSRGARPVPLLIMISPSDHPQNLRIIYTYDQLSEPFCGEYILNMNPRSQLSVSEGLLSEIGNYLTIFLLLFISIIRNVFFRHSQVRCIYPR